MATLRRSEPTRRRLAAAARLLGAAALAGCAALPTDAPRPVSHAFDQPLQTALGARFWPRLAGTPGHSGFRLLVSGQEALVARGVLADSAQRTLDLQYYIVGDDATATALLEGAARAARRGVRVRLLVDDLSAGGREHRFAALAGLPGVEVRLFNPFATRGSFGFGHLLELLGDGARLQRRMHNKAWIADGAAAVVGGRNLADAYFGAAPGVDFADLDVLAAGPVVTAMSRSFDAYWNSPWAVPLAVAGPPPGAPDVEHTRGAMSEQVAEFRASDFARQLREGAFRAALRSGAIELAVAPGEVFYNVPAVPGAPPSERSEVFAALGAAVGSATREVVMVTPYFVPGARGQAMLCGLAQRGVRVRVLTNSLASTDVPVVHAGYARYRPALAGCGVELHEMRPQTAARAAPRAGLSSGARLHSKAVLVDGHTLFLGSMNLDPRSRSLNTELALRIDSEELGGQVTALFDEATLPAQSFRVRLQPSGGLEWETADDGVPVRHGREPQAGIWRRWVLRLLAQLADEELL